MAIQPSFYRPLDSSKQEIRILEIVTASNKTNGIVSPLPSIECTVHTVSLLDKPVFNALSYVWGDANIIEEIQVEGVTVPITTSLAIALKFVPGHWKNEFRDRDISTFRIWADAICINQNDLDERAQQVQLMGHIYREAETVFSWLGNDLPHVNDAFHVCDLFNREMVNFEDVRDMGVTWMETYPELLLVERSDHTRGKDTTVQSTIWLSVFNLLRISYWKRVWIFQEITLAENALLVHGPKCLRYRHLHKAMHYLKWVCSGDVMEVNECESLVGDFVVSMCAAYSTYRPNLAIFDLMCETKYVMSTGRCNDIVAAPIEDTYDGIFQLLIRIGGFMSCTDPRDTVYGVLGLIDAGIVPDYRKAFKSVMLDLANSWINRTKRLRILGLAGVGIRRSRDPSIPSWIPPTDPLREPRDCRDGHGDCESTAETRVPWGAADQNIFLRETSPVITGSTLCVTALIGPKVSLIAADCGVASKDSVPTTVDLLYEMAHQLLDRYPNGISGVHPFLALLQIITFKKLTDHELHRRAFGMLRTVGMRDPECCKPVYADVFQTLPVPESIKQIYKNLHRHHILMRADSKEKEEENHALADQMYRFVLSEQAALAADFALMLVNYRVAEIESQYLALIPRVEPLEGNEHVCIVQGCNVPVVLRRVGDHYIHIGACYVAGLMDGEAIQWVQNGTSSPQEIKIR
jgi:Heterokaryon incompatibility protein (HET)